MHYDTVMSNGLSCRDAVMHSARQMLQQEFNGTNSSESADFCITKSSSC